MIKYKEAPWYWYLGTLIIAFVFGLVAVLKEDISLPAWAYVVSLILGMIIAPFVSSFVLSLEYAPHSSAEYPAILPLRERDRHQLAHEDACGCHHSRAPARQPLLLGMVAQRHCTKPEPGCRS